MSGCLKAHVQYSTRVNVVYSRHWSFDCPVTSTSTCLVNLSSLLCRKAFCAGVTHINYNQSNVIKQTIRSVRGGC